MQHGKLNHIDCDFFVFQAKDQLQRRRKTRLLLLHNSNQQGGTSGEDLKDECVTQLQAASRKQPLPFPPIPQEPEVAGVRRRLRGYVLCSWDAAY